MAKMEAKLKKKKKKLRSVEALIKESLQKSDEALAQKSAAEKRAELAEEKLLQAIHHAVEDYKKSKAFDDEMTKAGVASYQMGFKDCRDKVTKLDPTWICQASSWLKKKMMMMSHRQPQNQKSPSFSR